ncbi:spore cortex-lytic enzyme SleC [Clostridium sp. CAG:1219]|nr:spore cortex-lytic enzyme SleC [Clostridium sp. CAG:1219]
MLRKNRGSNRISMRNIFSRNNINYNNSGAINMNTKSGLTNEKNYNKMIIAKGSQGENVIKLQNSLNELANKYTDIPKLKIDGIFGDNTEKAVIQFQGMFNLTTDGVVGRYTWTAINDALLGKMLPKYKETEG